MRQHTSAIVQSESLDRQAARQYRRLVQAIFHGLNALRPDSRTKSLATPALRSWDGVLPLQPSQLWRDLFLIHYRESLERPGEWRLARVFARDQLKLELLFGFLKPWKLKWYRPPKLAETATIFDLLDADEVSARARDMILLSERQACTALNLSPSIAPLGDSTEDTLQDVDNKSSKYQVDRDILSLNTRAARRNIHLMFNAAFENPTMDESGSSEYAPDLRKENFLTILEKTAERAEILVSIANFRLRPKFTVSADESEVNSFLDSHALSAPSRRQLVNALSRYAECLAVIADKWRGMRARREFNAATRKRFGNRAKAPIPESAAAVIILRLFARAFAAYEIAEIIRRSTFRKSPFSGEHAVSGHATRGAIRLALILEREACRSLSPPELDVVRTEREGPGQYGNYAVRMKDELTRSLGRYPRERASLLILEASMIRILNEYRYQPDALPRALDFVEEAESVVVDMSPSARVRLRFLLERAKLHREIGRNLHSAGNTLWLQSFVAGRHDLMSLENLATNLSLPLWVSIAEIQLRKLEDVETDLKKIWS